MLSVIVPATNEPATLPRCLEALSAAMGDHDELVLLREGLGQSPARLRNDGARHAQGDVLVFVDADVVVHPDALELLRQAFASDARLTAAFGSYDRHPPAGVVSEFRNLLHRHVHRENAGEACTFWAGLGAIRRPAFLATGGFDEVAFPRPMLEDVELGLRLSGQGHRTAVMPEVQGRHLKRWTLRAMLSSDFRDRAIPWTKLLIRTRQVPATLNLGWRHRISAVTVLTTPIAAALTMQSLALLAGLLAMVLVNRRFYGDLARHGGAKLAMLGIALHVVHHASAILALPFGAASHLRHGAVRAPLPLQPVEMVA